MEADMNKNGMNTVIMNKAKLLEYLKANKIKHVAAYNEAIGEYWKELVAELSRLSERAKNKQEVGSYINLEIPKSHEGDYDMAIAMLENGINDIVVLEKSEFDRYVRDNWTWKAQFENSNAMYLAKKAK